MLLLLRLVEYSTVALVLHAKRIFCRTRVEILQDRYNQESHGSDLELVLFKDALLHLMRISR